MTPPARRPAFFLPAALLALLCSFLWTALDAHAFGKSSLMTPAIIRHGGDWDARLPALRSFAWEVSRRTSLRTFPEPDVVSLTSPQALFRAPFLYFGGTQGFPPLSEAEVRNLRRYLDMGGFLLADAGDGSDGYGFDASMRREIARLYPDRELVRLPSDHVAYRTYFFLDRQAGRTASRPFLWAVIDESGRAALIYSQNDLMGALQRNALGDWALEVVPGGSSQREMAIRLAVNLAMYAMCLDYKSDLLHLPYLMKKRRR